MLFLTVDVFFISEPNGAYDCVFDVSFDGLYVPGPTLRLCFKFSWRFFFSCPKNVINFIAILSSDLQYFNII